MRKFKCLGLGLLASLIFFTTASKEIRADKGPPIFPTTITNVGATVWVGEKTVVLIIEVKETNSDPNIHTFSCDVFDENLGFWLPAYWTFDPFEETYPTTGQLPWDTTCIFFYIIDRKSDWGAYIVNNPNMPTFNVSSKTILNLTGATLATDQDWFGYAP